MNAKLRQRLEALEARKEYARTHPKDKRHGTNYFYNYWACRCSLCRRANHFHRFPDERVVGLHEPSVYRVEEHRAFGEELCWDCERFLHLFDG
jgi:hypothetical protein